MNRSPFVPRLPSMPVRPYDPPVPPPAAGAADPFVLGAANSYEAQSINNLPWSAVRSTEIDIYQTHRRWRALDVYVNYDATITSAFILSVFIWSVTQSGQRALVASGRMGPGRSAASAWIAAARSVGEKYIVSAVANFPSAAATPTTQLQFTIAASDEMTEPRDTQAIGVASYVGDFVRFNAPAGLTAPRRLEVVGVRGINTAAAPAARYLQLYDTNLNTTALLAAAGLIPIAEWPLGAGDGSGVVDEEFRYRAGVAIGADVTYAPFLVVSSTPGVYTVAADGRCGISVR